MLANYISRIEDLITKVKENDQPLKKAAAVIAEKIKNDGLIYIFGCGHSHMIAEETFYRAGGLVPIHPIFIEELMLHEGAARSSKLERRNHFVQPFLDHYPFAKNDVMIIASTSGINGVPIDAALYAKEKGLIVIALTSIDYSQTLKSKHFSGQHLYDVADLVLDNFSAKGDAIMTDERLEQAFGPTSTIIGTLIINSVIVETIHCLAEQGVQPPLFLSGSIPGADEHNQALIEKYGNRITNL